jgi:protein-L-isoaspartate(D-aspartate) O-methyltransferase
MGSFSKISLWALFLLLFFSFSHADEFEKKRLKMVERDIKARGIKDEAVLRAMLAVERHLFVDSSLADRAYEDHPLPIGEGQTISQPYVVALMTEALSLKGRERVLEIGTGSGYQAAVLSQIAAEVYTIEIRRSLFEAARERLRRLGYKNVFVFFGDGYFGLKEYAPFDAIIVTAAANHIPPPLIEQLKDGGRLLIPVGSTLFHQTLTLIRKERGRTIVRELCPVIFVPMTGQMEKR